MAVYTFLSDTLDVTDALAQQMTFDPLGAAAVTSMGSITIKNTDTANTVWIAFDTQAVAEPGPGPYTKNNLPVAPGEAISLNRITFAFISLVCDAGLTATVKAFGTQGVQA